MPSSKRRIIIESSDSSESLESNSTAHQNQTTIDCVARNRPEKYNNVSLDKSMILIKCFKDGKTIKEAAETAGINKNTAYGIIKRYKKMMMCLRKKVVVGKETLNCHQNYYLKLKI